MINFDPNPLFYWMLKIFATNQQKPVKTKTVICNEGGSRSSKTYDEDHLLYWICDQLRNSERKLEMYVARRTLKRCRDLTYKDFRECLTVMGVYSPDNCYSENVAPVYDLFGHKIHFIGLDSSMEAVRNDVFLCAEVLEVESWELLRGWHMRCEMLAIYDWNPSVTQHWIFGWEGRPNVYFSKTTYLNNKHLNPIVRAEIESYNPDVPENVKNGTASQYLWDVYGLGLRSAREGVIYENVTWIPEMPKHLTNFTYGLDFGFTNDPTALSRISIDFVNRVLYAECLLYKPISDSHTLAEALISIGLTGNHIIIADSADAFRTSINGFVGDLMTRGFSVIKARKSPGYKTEAIGKVKGFKLVFVETKFAVKLPGGAYGDPAKFEVANYVWKIIHEKTVNTPEDGNDHWLDSVLYASQSYQEPMTAR